MRYLWLGSRCARRPTSLLSTRLLPPERRWRLRLESLWPRLWRRPDEYRLKPFAVLRKRFAAARLVFNLGMITPYIVARVRKMPKAGRGLTGHPLARGSRAYRRLRPAVCAITSFSVQTASPSAGLP